MIKKVGPTVIQERHKATCHCGSVELELHLPDGVNPFDLGEVKVYDGVNHPADRRAT